MVSPARHVAAQTTHEGASLEGTKAASLAPAFDIDWYEGKNYHLKWNSFPNPKLLWKDKFRSSHANAQALLKRAELCLASERMGFWDLDFRTGTYTLWGAGIWIREFCFEFLPWRESMSIWRSPKGPLLTDISKNVLHCNHYQQQFPLVENPSLHWWRDLDCHVYRIILHLVSHPSFDDDNPHLVYSASESDCGEVSYFLFSIYEKYRGSVQKQCFVVVSWVKS